jgi:hypothetical protein
MTEQFQTGSKKPGRGMSRASLDLIAAMSAIAEAAQPITGRGIGYKLFTAGLIVSMSVNEMQKVYRLLRIAREQGEIPWSWIVDETRDLERVSTWSDPTAYAHVIKQITDVGATFKSLRDTWADTTTAHGRLILTVLAGLAEFERELIVERTGEGRERRKTPSSPTCHRQNPEPAAARSRAEGARRRRRADRYPA